MIAVDTNLLIYAHRRESDEHGTASGILRTLAEGDSAWAIPWPCCYEFLSVVTNRRIWKDHVTSPERAWQQLAAWTASPSNLLIGETDDFRDVLKGFICRAGVSGAIVHDARIAALCVAHGVEALLSRDRDFSLFPELKIRNPFEPSGTVETQKKNTP